MPALNTQENSIGVGDILSAPAKTQAFQAEKPDVLERAIAATHSGGAIHDSNAGQAPRLDQKAAIIMRLLLANSGDFPTDGLDTSAVTRIAHAMAGLSYVDEATILGVIRDFLTELDSLALYFKPGLDGAVDALGNLVTEEVTARLSYTPTPDQPDDPWTPIIAMEASVLAKTLSIETPQVNGVVLSKIPASLAAEVLGELDPELAEAATVAALDIGPVEQDALLRIGKSLAAEANMTSGRSALPGDPVDRVGAMLNFAASADRARLLSGLDTHNAELAEIVRKTMFTFQDIPDRIEIKDVPKLVRAVENDVMVMALAAGTITETDTVEFILANLSKRLSEQLQEEITELGEVKNKDGDTAMNAVIQGIRDLVDKGELILISPEE